MNWGLQQSAPYQMGALGSILSWELAGASTTSYPAGCLIMRFGSQRRVYWNPDTYGANHNFGYRVCGCDAPVCHRVLEGTANNDNCANTIGETGANRIECAQFASTMGKPFVEITLTTSTAGCYTTSSALVYNWQATSYTPGGVGNTQRQVCQMCARDYAIPSNAGSSRHYVLYSAGDTCEDGGYETISGSTMCRTGGNNGVRGATDNLGLTHDGTQALDPSSVAPPGCYVVDTDSPSESAYYDMVSWNSATTSPVTCRDAGNSAYIHGGCFCRDRASERRQLAALALPVAP